MIKQRIFITGTMYTGSSLLSNLLSVHSKAIVLSDRVHFFRFIYGRYEPLNESNVHKMLLHQKARLHHRFNIEFDADAILANIKRRGFVYSAIYDEMMNYCLRDTKKEIWGDDSTLQWREIPDFLKIFPDGKVIHILRDPRAVTSSFKRGTLTANNGYLNAIFNGIDCLNHAFRFSASLSNKSYFPLRYEDLAMDPEPWVKKLCDFLEIDFEDAMLQPERWSQILDDKLVAIGTSSFDGKKVVGFSAERASRWKTVIERWELCLIEALAGDILTRHGYKLIGDNFSTSDFAAALAEIKKNEVVFKNFINYLRTGEGSNRFPTDPTDYRNWGTSSAKILFKDTPVAHAYLKEMENINRKFKGSIHE